MIVAKTDSVWPRKHGIRVTNTDIIEEIDDKTTWGILHNNVLKPGSRLYDDDVSFFQINRFKNFL